MADLTPLVLQYPSLAAYGHRSLATRTFGNKGGGSDHNGDVLKRAVLGFQRNEITEHYIYRELSRRTKGRNSDVLRKISEEELRHYNEWKEYTKTDVNRDRLALFKFLLVSRILGLTFVMKIMERGERRAEEVYAKITEAFPKAAEILREEVEHEKALMEMVDEEMVGYIGSLVLGLNDALVELTGALVGLTFTLQESKLIGAAGLITGIAASLSMAASEYLSQRSERGDKNPLRASLYTGVAYVMTVLLLIAPYLIFADYLIALGTTLVCAVLVVFIFTFFVSVVKEISFRRMFLEMLLISLGVAAVSFAIGWATREILGIEA